MLWRFLLPFPFFCFSSFTFFLDSFFLLFIIMVNGCFYAIAWLLCCVFMLRTHTASTHMKNRYEIVKFTCNHFVSISLFLFPLTTFSFLLFSSLATVNNKNVEEVLEKHSDNVCGITICRLFFC